MSSRNNLNTANTFLACQNNWRNQIRTIDYTPHAQFTKSGPLWLGFLCSLHFWSIALILTFSTIPQLVFAPVYILLHLHMYVYHQYTILGVQFRGVISWYDIEIEIFCTVRTCSHKFMEKIKCNYAKAVAYCSLLCIHSAILTRCHHDGNHPASVGNVFLNK